MERGTRIEAPASAGITRDHDDHPGAATMRGTGAVVLMAPEDEGMTNAWGVEYKCDVCGAIVVEMNSDTTELVRWALRAKGIETV